jgi:hypothetical protein
VKNYKIFLITILFSFNIFADVLKPALVEATIFADKIDLQIDLNLEAVLSETSTNLLNTKNTKNEDSYQKLRILPPAKLRDEFLKYKATFLQNIDFKIDGIKANLRLKNINIDNVGYIKRSRKSTLIFEINKVVKDNISWKYAQIYGDSAFRFRFFQKDKYSWNAWQIIQDELSIKVSDFRPLSTFENLAKFIQTGFYHVIPLGLDHILFIIVMSLAIAGFSRKNFFQLLGLVSSFTLAHTITLGLASSNIIIVNSQIIEILIATSIAFVTLQNLFIKYNHKRELIIVFIFGLLHGLGFATMLKSFISDDFISSLIGFNLGVEFAQILVVLLVLSVLFLINKIKIKQKFITIPVNVIIGIVATFMILERI